MSRSRPVAVSVEVPPRAREGLASWVRAPLIWAGVGADRAVGGRWVVWSNDVVRRSRVSRPTVIVSKPYTAKGVRGLEGRPEPRKQRITDDVAVTPSYGDAKASRFLGVSWLSN
jgi:hypothetical protein